ncbi:IS200/IS605 family transposase [Dactylosporangium sp. CA-233914]|uniref:IS200/IS605 family transposase n=1 Tax=Dactylosporangium sp. CA-233914 TaxID=3239934 RepID=UPI003D9030D0
MRAVCGLRRQLREFNGETNHVHLLVHYRPAVAPSKLVNSLKGASSRYLRQEHGSHLRRYLWGGHLWSSSYFAGSCGGAPPTVVKEYIETRNVPLGEGSPPGPEGPGFHKLLC